jgi:hypothetical protein
MRKTKNAIVMFGEHHFQKTAFSRMGEFCLKKCHFFSCFFPGALQRISGSISNEKQTGYSEKLEPVEPMNP